MDTSTITTKGQTTIPVNIRRKLHLNPGDRVRFFVNKKGIIELVPLKGSVRNLKGLLPKPKRAVSVRDMDRAIARHLKKEHTLRDVFER